MKSLLLGIAISLTTPAFAQDVEELNCELGPDGLVCELVDEVYTPPIKQCKEIRGIRQCYV